MEFLSKITAILFPVMMIGIGAADMTQPESFQEAMDGLSMPHYILYILGVAKMAGGLVLLAPAPALLREWAYAGFFIWWIGGLSVHTLSHHPLTNSVPLLMLGSLLIVSFLGYHKGRVIQLRANGDNGP